MSGPKTFLEVFFPAWASAGIKMAFEHFREDLEDSVRAGSFSFGAMAAETVEGE